MPPPRVLPPLDVPWWHRLLYNVVLHAVFPFVLPRYLGRMIRRGTSGRAFGQRLGLFSGPTRERIAAASGGLWIHAVSVGEVNLANLMIEEWRRRDPTLRIVLSCTTVTGQAVALKKLPADVPILFNPLDFIGPIDTALNLIQPRALILVEAEVWPNLVWRATQRGIPILQINARLSQKTERRYQAFRWFVTPLLRMLSCVCVQNERDRDRFIQLGLDADRVVVTGSMKFDVSRLTARPGAFDPVALLQQTGWQPGQPIWLAASTHRGEEKLVAKLFQTLASDHPDLFLVIAPRHFERGGEISRTLKSLGIGHKRRSKLKAECYPNNRVLLLDSTGEIAHLFPHVPIVFVGKSLCGRGGQNFLEPAQAGCAVLFGPHMEHFALQAEEFVAADAALRVASGEELASAIDRLLRDPHAARTFGERARALFESKLGATQITADALAPWTFGSGPIDTSAPSAIRSNPTNRSPEFFSGEAMP